MNWSKIVTFYKGSFTVTTLDDFTSTFSWIIDKFSKLPVTKMNS